MSPKKANSAQRCDDCAVRVCSSLSYGLMSHNRNIDLSQPQVQEMRSKVSIQRLLLQPPRVCYLLETTGVLYPGQETHGEVQGPKSTGSLLPPGCTLCPIFLTLLPCSVGWGQRHYPSGHPSWLPLGAQASLSGMQGGPLVAELMLTSGWGLDEKEEVS